MDETVGSGLRFGLVIRNSLVQHFVVMVVAETKSWQYRPGYDPVPRATAVVVSDGSIGARKPGEVTTITGKVGRDYGDWWVVES